MSHSMSGYTSGSSRTPSTSGPPPSYDGKSFAVFFCADLHMTKSTGDESCAVFLYVIFCDVILSIYLIQMIIVVFFIRWMKENLHLVFKNTFSEIGREEKWV